MSYLKIGIASCVCMKCKQTFYEFTDAQASSECPHCGESIGGKGDVLETNSTVILSMDPKTGKINIQDSQQSVTKESARLKQIVAEMIG